MAKAIPQFLFHYTVGPKLQLIADSGALLPKGFGARPNEKPVLWLSASTDWEPTATKVMSHDGGQTFARPSLQELQSIAGLYRFRIDTLKLAALDSPIRLVPWPRMGTVARIEAAQLQDMVRRGLQFGATPMNWWGCMDPVPLSLQTGASLTVEVRESGHDGQLEGWRQLSMKEALESFEELGTQFRMTTATNTPAARNI